MKNLFKLKFNKSSFDLDKDYDNFSESEKVTISSMNPDSFFDFNDDDGLYILYLIFDSTDIDRYSKILDNNLIEHTISNISESVLLDDICIDDELRPYLNALNRFKWTPFRKKIDDWIYERLDMDFILDRISFCNGIDNLRPIEKKFLRNFQN